MLDAPFVDHNGDGENIGFRRWRIDGSNCACFASKMADRAESSVKVAAVMIASIRWDGEPIAATQGVQYGAIS